MGGTTMKIAIAGGNGFIGSALITYFREQQHQLYILSRQAEKLPSRDGVIYVSWMGKKDKPELHIEGVDVFINLAGVSLNSGRWTASRKQAIQSSREITTKEVVRIINTLNKKPKILLQASAVGYYGTSNTKVFTEQDIVPATDFLSTTVYHWEQEAMQSGIRTVLMRFGVVLGVDGGAFSMMKLPYRLLVGGRIGSGQQPLPWIHIDDVTRAIDHCIRTVSMEGPVNFTAPESVTMEQFGITLAQAMQRPHWLPLPSFIMRLILGEMSMLLLEGQRVYPERLLNHGFIFSYPSLKAALTKLVQQQSKRIEKR